MALKAVFFDLDGTLLDTAPDLGGALNTLLQDYGREPLAEGLIRGYVSDGANALIKLGFEATPESENFHPLREGLLSHYLANLAANTLPFPGIESLIEKLAAHDVAWGIVTNKPWTYTEPLMKQFQFACPPVVTLCPDHVVDRKPHPESLILACERVGCDVSEAIYVGDHQRDIECGRRAGMPTIAVGYGYLGHPDEYKTWNATHAVAHGEELWPVISRYL
jgi:2-phosphoglycolate phosphatase